MKEQGRTTLCAGSQTASPKQGLESGRLFQVTIELNDHLTIIDSAAQELIFRAQKRRGSRGDLEMLTLLQAASTRLRWMSESLRKHTSTHQEIAI